MRSRERGSEREERARERGGNRGEMGRGERESER